ncbi:MAG: hypothetical protein ACRBN8_09790 [Nannocystales bacterium]
MQDALTVGFGRKYVPGWNSAESAWLIESSSATLAERMCSLPAREAERWIRLAEIEVSARVERRLLDHDVLVLVHRVQQPSFCASPDAVPLSDLRAPVEEELTFLEEARGWIEIEVRTASGAPAAGVRYELLLPGGDVLRGRTDSGGFIRHEPHEQHGDCEIRFPEVDQG